MQQKPSPPLPHEFIRKHKRKLSPKHQPEQLYTFKNPKPQHKKEEESHPQPQPTPKSQTNIVIDLKNQLSFLKSQMAKIVHAKLESLPNHSQDSKQQLLDHYFPKDTQTNLIFPKDTQTNLSQHPQRNQPTQNPSKTSLHQQFDDKTSQIKKLKSKERLKFSKIKKSDKFTPISPTKKFDITTEPSQNISQTDLQQKPSQQKLQPKSNKNPQNIRLSQQLQRISQRNKKALQIKLKSMVWQQQENININFTSLPCKEEDQKQQALKVLSLTPQKQQKPAVYQLKITRLKKKIKQIQQELDAVKIQLKQKSASTTKLQYELQKTKAELTFFKQNSSQKQQELALITTKLSDSNNQKSQIISVQTQSAQQIKIIQNQCASLKEQNTVLEHKLKNRDYEIIKLEKIIKNLENQLKENQTKNSDQIDSLKSELKIWKQNCEKQMEEKNSILEEAQKKNKIAVLPQQQSNKNMNLKLEIKEESLTQNFSLMGISSPRNNVPASPKQKEYLTVIKMHQKSIQNYQKDLNFLQSECKTLHHFKIIAKKQQFLIKDVNQALINEQLALLNAKYEKKLGSITNSTKDAPQIVMKRLSTKSGQQSSTG